MRACFDVGFLHSLCALFSRLYAFVRSASSALPLASLLILAIAAQRPELVSDAELERHVYRLSLHLASHVDHLPVCTDVVVCLDDRSQCVPGPKLLTSQGRRAPDGLDTTVCHADAQICSDMLSTSPCFEPSQLARAPLRSQVAGLVAITDRVVGIVFHQLTRGCRFGSNVAAICGAEGELQAVGTVLLSVKRLHASLDLQAQMHHQFLVNSIDSDALAALSGVCDVPPVRWLRTSVSIMCGT